MIAVEKGLVTLDQNVREVVPELADLEVLEGFDDDGKPRLRKTAAPISLRSGFCYDKQDQGLQRWNAYVGKKEGTFMGSYIEVVAKQNLETFMQENIWAPLKMGSTTFQPWLRPDLEADLVELALRKPDGSLMKGKVPYSYPAPNCCGGVGLYSTPSDQTKFLSALLDGGAGIISKEGLDEILKSQTEDPSHFISQVCGGSKRAHLGQTWPEGHKGDFGLSSSINDADFPGRRAAKSANWQGMPGVHAVSCQIPLLTLLSREEISYGSGCYFCTVPSVITITIALLRSLLHESRVVEQDSRLTIAQWLDRTTGLAGVFVTQILPPGDKLVTKCFCELEEAVYQSYRS
ncbi:MAG: hypothetical protein Q9195_002313 [Heterodermia aff. obscurata]